MAYLVSLAIVFFVLTATPARNVVIDGYRTVRSNEAVSATISKGFSALSGLRAAVGDRIQSWIRTKAHQELDSALDRELK